MFHILERELQWRREQGRPEGFGVLKNSRPVIAVGAKEPLEEQKVMQDYFREYSFLWADRRLYANAAQTERMAWEKSIPR